MAEMFLKKPYGRYRVWHLDGDQRNNCYKNLVYISDKGRKELLSRKVKIEDLDMSGIYERCYNREGNPESFIDWYLKNYYSIPGETMVIDKEYSPKTCCILPQSLNILLTNCKKHKAPEGREESENPYGVNYNKKKQKFYGYFQPIGHKESIKLSYWDTPEDAFTEYKKYKQADILIAIAKYKNMIPLKAYEALVGYEVKPFIEE